MIPAPCWPLGPLGPGSPRSPCGTESGNLWQSTPKTLSFGSQPSSHCSPVKTVWKRDKSVPARLLRLDLKKSLHKWNATCAIFPLKVYCSSTFDQISCEVSCHTSIHVQWHASRSLLQRYNLLLGGGSQTRRRIWQRKQNRCVVASGHCQVLFSLTN